MRQSQVTGKYIYEQLDKLYRELKEIREARDAIKDDYSSIHIAYKLLNEKYELKQKELSKLEIISYTQYLDNMTLL